MREIQVYTIENGLEHSEESIFNRIDSVGPGRVYSNLGNALLDAEEDGVEVIEHTFRLASSEVIEDYSEDE